MPDNLVGDIIFEQKGVDEYSYYGAVPLYNGGPALWANKTMHTFIGKIKVNNYVFFGEKNQPLKFQIDKNVGYKYISGKGTITYPDGKVIKLPLKK